jgi:hypothetical protein
MNWNAPSEVVHPLGYVYPDFRRTKGWLGNERSPKIEKPEDNERSPKISC